MADNPPQPALLRQKALQFLVHSFLYYRLDEPVINDVLFDSIAEELRALRATAPEAEMPFADIVDPQLGPEASAFSIRAYPPTIVTTAFKLLYAVSNSDLDFVEFTERRGYRGLIDPQEETENGKPAGKRR